MKAGKASSGKAIVDEGELETKARLRKENPKLPRPFCLRAASGRYTRDMPVEVDLDISIPLEVVTPRTFSSYISEVAGADQLCVILCSRADTQEHVWAEQLMEYVMRLSVLQEVKREKECVCKKILARYCIGSVNST